MEILVYFIIGIISIIWAVAPIFWFAGRSKNKKLMQQVSTYEEQLLEKNKLIEKLSSEVETYKKEIQSTKLEYEEKTKNMKEEVSLKLASGKKELLDKEKHFEMKVEASRRATEAMANYFVNDSVKFILSKITAQNYETSKNRIGKVFQAVEKCSVKYPEKDERQFYEKLKEVYANACRKEEARIEQQRIKEHIRDEQRAEKERVAQIHKLENQESAIQEALNKALKNQSDQHVEEIERLKAMLAAAHEESERAKSQAQLTRSGHVYVISNLGSFGEDIFKVGMTRRLEPMDRVKELGDASVPFTFDVHMMISCEDAPALEVLLHKELHNYRVNRVNLRKEFFRVDLQVIKELVEANHGEVSYQASQEAFQYRESILLEEQGKIGEYNSDCEDSDEDFLDVKGAA